MEIKKLFTSAGLTGTKEIFFKDLSPASGINLIYFTPCTYIQFDKNSICGFNFLNSSSKIKTTFNTFILPPAFTFYNTRVQVLKYQKYFKMNASKFGISGRITKKIINNKTELPQKSNFYDLSVLAEPFLKISTVSEIKAVSELIKILKNIQKEFQQAYYKKDTYILIETDENYSYVFEILLKYNRINNFLVNDTTIKGILVKFDNQYYPLTQENLTLTSRNLAINIQAYNNLTKKFSQKLKANNSNDNEHYNTNKDKSNESTSSNYAVHVSDNISIVDDGGLTSTTTLTSEEKTLHKVEEKFKKAQELNNIIKDTKTDLKINTILNQANDIISHHATETKENKDKVLKKIEENPKFKKYKKEIEHLKKINFKFNGSIDINENILPKRLYFKPLEATGIKTFTGYNKQQTEFDEVLDESMFDLFKSLEIDKDIGIEVKDIKIRHEDNIKNRFKIYKLKLKNTKFGYDKAYTVELKVPYPSQGKYIKLDSNNYIMFNQLFPYPILKVQPNVVRIYTHYSTAAVELKGTINTTNDLLSIKEKFLINLTSSKTKVKTSDLDENKKQEIKDKYNLPLDLNDKLLTNIEIN